MSKLGGRLVDAFKCTYLRMGLAAEMNCPLGLIKYSEPETATSPCRLGWDVCFSTVCYPDLMVSVFVQSFAVKNVEINSRKHWLGCCVDVSWFNI